MTAAVTTAPRGRHAVDRDRSASSSRRAAPLFEPGAPTLDDRIAFLWERLGETGRADCPVCGSEFFAGRECGGCGSELT